MRNLAFLSVKLNTSEKDHSGKIIFDLGDWLFLCVIQL